MCVAWKLEVDDLIQPIFTCQSSNVDVRGEFASGIVYNVDVEITESGASVFTRHL